MVTKKDFVLIKKISFIDFKLRYNASVLGFVWSLLNPLLMLTVLYFIFSILRGNQTGNYILFLLLGIISWNYFSTCTKIGMSSILSKATLIKKMYINKEIFVIASCLTSLYSFLLNLVVFIIIMFITGIDFHYINLIYFLPLLSLFILTLGISFGLSAIYTKYRDLNEIWAVLIRAGFFLAPIIYPISIIPDKYLSIYLLNPFTRILIESRNLLISNKIPSFMFMLKTLIMSCIVLLCGYLIFKSRESKMVEEL